MSKQLISNKAMSYAGRALRSGDRFDAKDKDARVLVAIGKASPYVAPVRVEKPAVKKVISAKAGPVTAAAKVEEEKVNEEDAKAEYMRRDMTAE